MGVYLEITSSEELKIRPKEPSAMTALFDLLGNGDPGGVKAIAVGWSYTVELQTDLQNSYGCSIVPCHAWRQDGRAGGWVSPYR